MFLDYFRLREQPFGMTPDPRFLFPSPGHREALASLIYGIESNLGFGSLIAKPGLGKTTLLFHILEQYRRSARTAFIFNTQCDSSDLLRSLLVELDDQPLPGQTYQLHERFKQLLASDLQARRRVIVVIDEAQNLADTVMETVRLLSNFESANFKLLHIILAGQPELAVKLARPELSQLQQRIPILANLPQLTAGETLSYIGHRLQVAGYRGKGLFTRQAMADIARLSQGVPREINRLCFNCLSLAYASSKPTIDPSVVDEVAADLDLDQQLRRENGLPQEATLSMTHGMLETMVASARARESQGEAQQPTQDIPKHAALPIAAARPSLRQRTALREPNKSTFLRRPRKYSTTPFSLSNSWETCRRPVAFALFYLTLIAAGWSAITQWAYSNASASSFAKAADQTTPAGAFDTRDVTAGPQRPFASPIDPITGKAVSTGPTNSSHLATARRDPVMIPETIGYRSTFDLPLAEPTGPANALPELVRYSRPLYPDIARQRHLEGTVVLAAIVAKNGRVKSIKPLTGDPILQRAAEDAVYNWAYRPYFMNGRPVDVNAEIVISFSLGKAHKP